MRNLDAQNRKQNREVFGETNQSPLDLSDIVCRAHGTKYLLSRDDKEDGVGYDEGSHTETALYSSRKT